MSGQLLGTIHSITERGEWRTVLIQRDPADQYERDHADRTMIPFDLSPHTRKKVPAGVLTGGVSVAVEYQLTGREYNGKRYLSAVIESIEAVGGAVAEPDVESAGAAGVAPVIVDEALPF